MYILAPITVESSMIGAATTIAEPAAGETAWVSAGTYVVGDLRIRGTTHIEYECVLGHTGRTALPENDPVYWLAKRPTQRFAPFDLYTSTAASTITSLTYVLTPGYFNAVSLYGITGTTLTVTLKDVTGGTVIHSETVDLSEPPLGWYEYLFSPRRVINKVLIKDLPIRPAAELTLTISTGSGQPVGVGMINVGDFASLIGAGDSGGTNYGSSAEPVTQSTIDIAADGTLEITRRAAATNMRAVVTIPKEEADQALYRIQTVLDVPVSWVATDAAGFLGLNVFGIATSSVEYNDGFAKANIFVRGLI